MAGFGLIGKGKNPVAVVDQDLQIWGLYHLIGSTVQVAILGLDLGDFVVATDGSVTVSLVDTVSQTASWSAAELIAADGANGGAAVQTSVSIVAGVAYVSQGQRLRAAAAADSKTPTGESLGMTRRADQYAVLFQNTVALRVGTMLTPTPLGNMVMTTFRDAGGTPLADGVAFSGVYQDSLVNDYSFDSMFCWQIDRPYPCTIVSATSFIETDER